MYFVENYFDYLNYSVTELQHNRIYNGSTCPLPTVLVFNSGFPL